ncbi:hypothetical protein NQ315_004370, partial [Exocentrus adspersus]
MMLIWAIGLTLVFQVNASPLPGYHHVRHRIYVPTKIKTIHHTKIIKVPEHHHYFHEKEKIILEAPHHHKDEHKLGFKDLEVKLPSFEHGDEGLDNFSGSYHSGSDLYGGEGHNIFKKHAIAPERRKLDAGAESRKGVKEEEEEEEDGEYEDEDEEDVAFLAFVLALAAAAPAPSYHHGHHEHVVIHVPHHVHTVHHHHIKKVHVPVPIVKKVIVHEDHHHHDIHHGIHLDDHHGW